MRLYPAEYGLMIACEKGLTYECKGFKKVRPTEKSESSNLVRADFLRFLILGGDASAPVSGRGVNLRGAYISCRQSEDIPKLNLFGQDISNDISLYLCHIDGMLAIRGASIKSLGLTGSYIKGLRGDRLKADGSIHLRRGFHSKGVVRLINCEISGDLDCSEGYFESKEVALNLRSSVIKGQLTLKKEFTSNGSLKFNHCQTKILKFDRTSWQNNRNVEMDGFEYNLSAEEIHKFDKNFWIEHFLGQQKFEKLASKQFKPAAHKKLADALNVFGHEEEARAVNIDRRKRTVAQEWTSVKDHGDLFTWCSVVWRKFSGPLIGYGYRPSLAVFWMTILWLACTPIYHLAKVHGIMTPSDPLIYQAAYDGRIDPECRKNWTTVECGNYLPSEHSEFYSPAYSLDVLLPIIDFRQHNDWAPRVVYDGGQRNWWGWSVRKLEWMQTAFGWLLSLLLVSSVTGIIRKD